MLLQQRCTAHAVLTACCLVAEVGAGRVVLADRSGVVPAENKAWMGEWVAAALWWLPALLPAPAVASLPEQACN